ncbi:hypothetical protein POX_e06594 [Penicillium oxalicum]|nr:hypothetical protein POX_e06594 [Penicillium oxalicum]KAI2788575.1 hypothetical protein POX_e06594 [Penicillium oxalicum]
MVRITIDRWGIYYTLATRLKCIAFVHVQNSNIPLSLSIPYRILPPVK